ncbi:MAG: hypothetical protein AAF648_15600 [Pseudomonadota bacterium]
MTRATSVLALLLALYPLSMLWAGPGPDTGTLLVGFAALVGLRITLDQRLTVPQRALSLLALAAFCTLAAQDPELRLFKTYPIAICGAGFAFCLLSLRHPPSAIERLVRRMGIQPNAAQVRYLRGVTWLWAGFFAVNATVTAWLVAYGTTDGWALYTGGISYLLMALLFAGEYAFRRWYQARYEGSSR